MERLSGYEVFSPGASPTKSRGLPKIREYAPDRFESFIKLFDGLNAAVRLLKIKKIELNFSNISRSVEAIAGRRFTCNHLAQIKYLMPECLEISRTNVLNERTGCRNPDLLLNFNPDAIPSKVQMDVVTKLKKIFRSKLKEFSKSHPEIEEVPEATLPEPFNKMQASPMENTLPWKNKRISLEDVIPASHFPPSRKHKVLSINLKGVELATPMKKKQKLLEEDLPSFISTPIKDIPVPNSPFSMNPIQPLQKGASTEKSTRKFGKSVFRSLFTKPAEDPIFSNEFIESVSYKERKIEEDENKKDLNRKKTMMVKMPMLFDKIHFLYQSMNKSVISKEQLIHKLVFRDLGLIDRGELEEELNLMMELIPNYISENILLSGDRMIRVNKSANCTYAREQLEAAKQELCKETIFK